MSAGYVREFGMSALVIQPLLESSPQGSRPDRTLPDPPGRRKGCMPAYSQAVGRSGLGGLIVPGRSHHDLRLA